MNMKDERRKVKAVNVVRDGGVIHTVKISPPASEFSQKVESVVAGLIRRTTHDDSILIEEVYE